MMKKTSRMNLIKRARKQMIQKMLLRYNLQEVREKLTALWEISDETFRLYMRELEEFWLKISEEEARNFHAVWLRRLEEHYRGATKEDMKFKWADRIIKFLGLDAPVKTETMSTLFEKLNVESQDPKLPS